MYSIQSLLAWAKAIVPLKCDERCSGPSGEVVEPAAVNLWSLPPAAANDQFRGVSRASHEGMFVKFDYE
jgi:hypothetical protein